MKNVLDSIFTNEVIKEVRNINIDQDSMTRYQEVTLQDVINLLNEMLKIDPLATEKLISNRVDCNETLAGHKTVQVGIFNGSPKVGILGVINGLFDVDENGYGAIAGYYDQEGKLFKFDLFQID